MALGEDDSLGLIVGYMDLDGSNEGTFDLVGPAVGESVALSPQYRSEPQGSQRSVSVRKIAPPLGLEERNPEMHLQRELNKFPSVPTDSDEISKHCLSYCKKVSEDWGRSQNMKHDNQSILPDMYK